MRLLCWVMIAVLLTVGCERGASTSSSGAFRASIANTTCVTSSARCGSRTSRRAHEYTRSTCAFTSEENASRSPVPAYRSNNSRSVMRLSRLYPIISAQPPA